MPSFFCRALVATLAVLFLLAPFTFAVEAVWIGGPTGNWSEAANWSTGVVPNDPAPLLFRTLNAAIDNNSLQQSVVVLDQNAIVRQLILDAGDTLQTEVGRNLESDFVMVSGDVHLATGSQLRTVHALWIQSSGEVVLQPSSKLENVIPNTAVWNQGRIEGGGAIDGIFNNEGMVSANVAGKTLQLNIAVFESGTNENSGQLIAENGGILSIASTFAEPAQNGQFLTNTTGLIEARGDSSVLLAGGLILNGGLVRTTSEGGTEEGLVTVNGARLENVRLDGNVQLNAGSLAGIINNNSSAVPDTGAVPGNRWTVIGPVTLAGTGRLTLQSGDINPANPVASTPVQPYLTNEAGHTIAGTGFINRLGATRMPLTNRGLIENTGGSLEIFIAPGDGTENTGVMRALGGGTLRITGNSSSSAANQNYVFNNFSEDGRGSIVALAGSTVALGRMTLRGGILQSRPPVGESSEPAGVILSAADAQTTLRDIRLEGTIGDATSSWRLMGEIENTDVLNATTLQIMGPTTLSGGGHVRVSQQVIGDTSSPAYESLVNEDNVIGGRGVILGAGLAVRNRGTIQADEDDQILIFSPPSSSSQSNPVINTGILQAINGGILHLDARVLNYEWTEQGVINAGDGSQVRITRVEGGKLTTQGTGSITTSGESYLTNVTNDGSLQTSGSLRIMGELINDGTIQTTRVGSVTFEKPIVVLSGSGVWQSSTASLDLRVGLFSQLPTVLIHGPDHTIRGRGTIDVRGSFINYGTIQADSDEQSLEITLQQRSTMVQRGTLSAPWNPNAKTIQITTHEQTFVNEGLIEAGGYIDITRLSEGPMDFINAAGAEIRLGLSLGVHSQDTATSPVTVWNQVGGLITGVGGFNLKGDSSQYQPLLRNSGTIRPGGVQFPYGHLSANSDFVQDPTGVLDFDITGPPSTGWYDRIVMQDGDAALGGTLAISLNDEDGYDPDVGDSFELLLAIDGTVTGMFDTFTAPALSGRWWSLNYLADKVVLSVEQITADFNADGVVDGDDLVVWQTSHGVNGLADADGDGDTDGRDFLEWQRQFGSGVAGLSSTVVPEPTTLALLALTVVLANSRRADQRRPAPQVPRSVPARRGNIGDT